MSEATLGLARLLSGPRSALVFLVFIGCSAPAAAPSNEAAPAAAPTNGTLPAASDEGATGAKADASPEVVELEPSGDEPQDCAAEGPKEGSFDVSSPRLRRIEIRRGRQIIEERAFLRDSDVVVTSRLGGCAHYAAHYTVVYSDARATSDRAHHVSRALDVLEAFPFKAGTGIYVDDLSKLIRPLFDKPKELEQCSFAHGGMTQISCHVDAPEKGRMRVTLSYDIVL